MAPVARQVRRGEEANILLLEREIDLHLSPDVADFERLAQRTGAAQTLGSIEEPVREMANRA